MSSDIHFVIPIASVAEIPVTAMTAEFRAPTSAVYLTAAEATVAGPSPEKGLGNLSNAQTIGASPECELNLGEHK